MKLMLCTFIFCSILFNIVMGLEMEQPQKERSFSVTLSIDENNVLKMEMFGKDMPVDEGLLFLERNPIREKYDEMRIFYSDSINRRMRDSSELHPHYVELLTYVNKNQLDCEHVFPPTDFIPYWHCIRQKKSQFLQTPLKDAEELAHSLILETREKTPEIPTVFITFGIPRREVEEFSSIDEAVKAVKSNLTADTRYEKIFFCDDRTLSVDETRSLLNELVRVALEHNMTFEHFVLTSGTPPVSTAIYRYQKIRKER